MPQPDTGVPAPQAYESLETGTLDGVAFPYDAMRGFRLAEQLTYHTEVPLYTLTFYLVMNKQVFDSLPEELQQVLLDNSGMEEALRVAASWQEEEELGRAFSLEQNGQIIEVPREEIRLYPANGITIEPRRVIMNASAVQTRRLLERHGVLTREAVRGEGITGGFDGVYPVLRAMEEAGRIRRGYFIAGLGGAQFALPGAVDRLRSVREPTDERPLVLAATDPANPYGITVEWPRAVTGALRPPAPSSPGSLALARSTGQGLRP